MEQNRSRMVHLPRTAVRTHQDQVAVGYLPAALRLLLTGTFAVMGDPPGEVGSLSGLGS